MILRRCSTAKFRGPGVRHNFEDSGDDYDLNPDQRNRGAGSRSGRIILLGDGTEVLTESDDTEMFDHEEEDKDLASQVTKGQRTTNDEDRGAREETPGPEAPASTDKQQQTTSTSSDKKVIPESAIPEKLVASPTN